MFRRTVLTLLVFLPAACGPPAGPPAGELGVVSLLGDDGGAADGYARAVPGRVFRFPRDHGAHPDFRSEWWYFTGQLETGDARAFGFQLTFFRFALAPAPREGASAWGTRQAWMAHFAVTDVAGARFHARERLERGALGLAGARDSPFRVWLGDWQAVSTGDGLFPLILEAVADEVGLRLELDANKPLVLQGEGGYSAKGPEPGNASLYYAYTRLSARGRLTLGGETLPVSGEAWLDREWSTSALGKGLAGWDWFSLQLDDGSELMLYQLRREDGTASPFSAATLVRPDGSLRRLPAEEFRLEPGRRWTSPSSGARYPVAWRVTVPSLALELGVEPLLDGQEMDLSVRYWEGAVRARGERDGRPVHARGYLELTGY